MRWGHDFLRIRGGGIVKRKTHHLSSTLLSYSTNQLILQGVSWAVIALGLGEYGQPSILAGLLDLTTRFPKGVINSSITLTWKERAADSQEAAFHSHTGSDYSLTRRQPISSRRACSWFLLRRPSSIFSCPFSAVCFHSPTAGNRFGNVQQVEKRPQFSEWLLSRFSYPCGAKNVLWSWFWS